MRLRASIVMLVAAIGLALGGCGSSSVTVSHHTATPSTTSVPTGGVGTVTLTQTVTTTTTTMPSTPSTTPTTAAATGSACVAADLTPVFLGQNGASGSVVLGVALRNRGASACHTYGWPGVAFTSKTGALLPTKTTRTTEDILGSTPATVITLAPGQEASFRLIASDSGPGGSNRGCRSPAGLQIIAPDDTATMRVSLPAGVSECGRGTLSPLQTGTSAVPGV